MEDLRGRREICVPAGAQLTLGSFCEDKELGKPDLICVGVRKILYGELALSAGALHQTCCWELSLLVGLVMVCVGKEHGRGWEEDSTLGKGAVFLPASSISHLLTDFQLTFWDFSYTVYVCVYVCASPQLFTILTMAHAGAYVAGWWFDGSLVQHRADPSCAGLTPLTQSCQYQPADNCCCGR